MHNSPSSTQIVPDPTSWLGDALPDIPLSKAQTRVVGVIAGNPQLSSYAELSDIAERAGVNSSTVVRTAQSLGYRGWPDLQRELRARYLATISTVEKLTDSGNHQSPVHAAIHHDIENLQLTLEANSSSEVESTVSALSSARSIKVIGSGSFAGPATVMAHLGSTMGYPSSREDRGGLHLVTSINTLDQNDVLVVMNVWRQIREVLSVAESAKQAGVTIVVVTDMRHGPLAAVADHLLIIPSEGISFFQSVTTATSVIYGLLSGMEAAQPERSRAILRRSQNLGKELDIYVD